MHSRTFSRIARPGVALCVQRLRLKALECVGTDASDTLSAFADDLEVLLGDESASNTDGDDIVPAPTKP